MSTASMRFGSSFGADRRMLKGVCATVADRAGVPVWMPRAAFVVFGVLHSVLAIILYVVLVKVFGPVSQPVAALPPLRERLGMLDARLAELEAATLREAGLRREFRDLERN